MILTNENMSQQKNELKSKVCWDNIIESHLSVELLSLMTQQLSISIHYCQVALLLHFIND